MLLGIELLIVFLDVFVNHYEWSSIASIRRMVNITREDSLSNWFSSIQAIIVGSVIWLIAFAVRNRMHDNHYKRKFYCWACIGIFFIYVGIDDAIKFHERMGTACKVLLARSAGSSDPGILYSMYEAFPSYPWQMILGLFYGNGNLSTMVLMERAFLKKTLVLVFSWYKSVRYCGGVGFCRGVRCWFL